MTPSIFELGLHFDLYTPVNFSVCILKLLHHLELSTGRNINNCQGASRKKIAFLVEGPALQSHRVKMMPALLSWAGEKDSYASGINPVSLVLKKKIFY